MTFNEWLQYGIDNGFCDKPHCWSHEYPEMSDDEEQILEEDGELCISIVRLY